MWVEDLFTRAYETVSLMNVDFWRRARRLRWRREQLVRRSPMTGWRRLSIRPWVAATRCAIGNYGSCPARRTFPSRLAPMPASGTARLPTWTGLKDLIAAAPARLAELVRGPFEVETGEGGNATTMRMPPFMRQSNAAPLTLAAWQYALLMRWVEEPQAGTEPRAVAAAEEVQRLSDAAARAPRRGARACWLRKRKMPQCTSRISRRPRCAAPVSISLRRRRPCTGHSLQPHLRRRGRDEEAENEFAELDLAAARLAEPAAGEEPLDTIAEPAPQSISLNVSSSCNLTCSYCYAARGSFNGAQPAPMEWPTAQAAIDRLLSNAVAGAPITVGFLGGEPFVNRRLIHRAVAYAASRAALGLDVRFSVTTNGTLLEADDLALFREYPFAVTVSLDGTPAIHDRQRPRHRNGAGSWRTAIDRVAPLLATPEAKIAARATVTRHSLDIRNGSKHSRRRLSRGRCCAAARRADECRRPP